MGTSDAFCVSRSWYSCGMWERERLRAFAREMRSDATLGEAILWRNLRARRMGVRVRRQEPVGPFIADFVCFEHRLIVEVDGDSHRDPARDHRRDRWFLDNGWYVLRFWDDDVINDTERVLDIIWMAIHDRDNVADPLNRET